MTPCTCHYCEDTLEQATLLYPVEVETPAFRIPRDRYDLTTFNRKEGTQYPTQTVGRYWQCLACHTCIQTLQSRRVGVRQTAGPVKP